MTSPERLYEYGDRTGSSGDKKEAVMQPGEVGGTFGFSSREGPDEDLQYLNRGSHDCTSGMVLSPVGQHNLREVDSVQASNDPCNNVNGVTEPPQREDRTTAIAVVTDIKATHIPEFDPEKNYITMPKWMEYDPSKVDKHARYICIVCNVQLEMINKELSSMLRGKSTSTT